jgi:hypothetical protein
VLKFGGEGARGLLKDYSRGDGRAPADLSKALISCEYGEGRQGRDFHDLRERL